jgi:hypothetical protein
MLGSPVEIRMLAKRDDPVGRRFGASTARIDG